MAINFDVIYSDSREISMSVIDSANAWKVRIGIN
jgi:hypothetical protein